ncbi:hypothetical protein AX16_006195 [Volvariella volvacea WC 439]|nr:hypothetical protein AX16_006195 [Volvariella volvacea WC 439]
MTGTRNISLRPPELNWNVSNFIDNNVQPTRTTSALTIWVTSVAINANPRTYQTAVYPHTIPPSTLHALIINLVPIFPFPSAENSSSALAARLQNIVASDGQGYPRIDSVAFRGTDPDEWPSEQTWKALDGLVPKHLQIHCGFMEECDIWGLTKHSTPWPLESLLISGLCGDISMPDVCSNITSLTFSYCHAIGSKPRPKGGYKSLTEISVSKNEAIFQFTTIMRHVFNSELIESIRIDCTDSSTAYGTHPHKFRDAVSQCTRLKRFELMTDYISAQERYLSSTPEIESGDDEPSGLDRERHDIGGGSDDFDTDMGPLGDEVRNDEIINGSATGSESGDQPEIEMAEVLVGHDEDEDSLENESSGNIDYPHIGLPQCLPNGLHHLKFIGTGEMQGDLEEWIQHAKDPNWLPDLQTCTFGLVADKSLFNVIKEGERIPFIRLEKVEEFLSILVEHRPSLKIIR